nr:unnamed protein product [Callosobruchus chinensis]
MSGYKRVSFYELCRLCASNTQKEKVHIFREEGKKIQLQNKIETCLALTVNENDFLPKVVCSKCLCNLETCYVFRQECVRSETMLSTYFKNFRYTDDFKKSGKVYIKDTKPPIQTQSTPQPMTEVLTAVNPTNNNIVTTTSTSVPAATPQVQQNVIPFYTLQLPAIVTNPNAVNQPKKEVVTDASKINQNQFAYNLNLINTSNIKTTIPKNEPLNNIVINGEVINISQMGDLDTLLNQGSVLKSKVKSKAKKVVVSDDSVVKIDLTNPEVGGEYQLDSKSEKLPHIKSTTMNQASQKYNYSVKVEEKNQNQTVIFPVSEYNQNYNYNAVTTAMYTQPTVVNTVTNTSVVCSTQTTTVDNSILSMNLNEGNQTEYTNLVNAVAPSEDPKPNSNSNQSPSKSHMCDICLKTFKRREHLGQHIKLHTGFRPYICEQCNKAFMRKEHLVRHSTLHSGQKNYTCNICEKSFSRNDNLLKHKKTHEKQASYTCEVCQKQFVMKHYYNAHMVVHGDKCYGNMWWVAPLILLLLVVPRTLSLGRMDCSKSEYEKCIRMADPLVREAHLVFPDNINDIDQVCTTWNQFVDCLKVYTDECFTTQQRKQFNRAVESPIASVHQMCTQPSYQKEYLQYAPCIKSTIIERSHCGPEYNLLVEQVDQGDVISKSTLCCSHDRFKQCVERETRRLCDRGISGGPANKFATQIIDKALRFLQDQCLNYIPNSGDCQPHPTDYALSFSRSTDSVSSSDMYPWSTSRLAPKEMVPPVRDTPPRMSTPYWDTTDCFFRSDQESTPVLGSRSRPASYGRANSWGDNPSTLGYTQPFTTPGTTPIKPDWAGGSTWAGIREFVKTTGAVSVSTPRSSNRPSWAISSTEGPSTTWYPAAGIQSINEVDEPNQLGLQKPRHNSAPTLEMSLLLIPVVVSLILI